jgi:hypothetical protein
MENSNIKSSYQIAITALISVITAIVLHFLIIGVHPLIIGVSSGVIAYIASTFLIEACNSYGLFQSVKSSAAKPLEAPVEASKVTETQAEAPEVAAPVEAPKPVESTVEVAVDSKPVEEKKPEPVAPVGNRIVMKKKAPKK